MSLEFKSISKQYNNKIILNNISLKIERGIIGIIGANGSGKTTLMKILTGLITADSGVFYFSDKKIDFDSIYWKEKIGYLPQSIGLYERMTPFEYLDYLLLLSRWKNKKKRLYRINEILECLNLTESKDKAIGHLSGGTKQRVAISQSIIHNPEIIFLDEPTNNLDAEERNRLNNYLINISQDKIIIMIGHIIEELANICSKVIIIDKGEIKYHGSTEFLIESQCDFVKEIKIIKQDFNNEIKKKVRILSLGQNTNEFIIRYDKRFYDFSDGIVTLPTLSEAYQTLLNLKELKYD